MKRRLLKPVGWLLMLAILTAGVDAALSEPLHVGHVETPFDSGPGNPGEPDEHEGHCCHAAGHLVGVVSAAGVFLAPSAWISQPAGVSLLSEPGQAPPTPPPTR